MTDFTTLYTDCYQRLYNRAAFLVGHDAADDVVQEAFVSIWRVMERGQEVNYSYCNRAVTNAAIDFARRAKSRVVCVELDEAISIASESDVERLEFQETMRDMFATLNPSQAALLALYAQGYGFGEIVEMQAETRNCTVQRIRMARQRIRRWYAKEVRG